MKYIPQCYFALIGILIIGCSRSITSQEPRSFASSDFTEIVWSKEMEDPYRAIEDLSDSTVINWMKVQSEYAYEKMGAIRSRDSLLQKMLEFSARTSTAIRNTKITTKGEYFYLKRNADEEQFKLYYRESYEGLEKEILDPRNLKMQDSIIPSISYFNPSWDGNKIVFGITHSGKEISTLRVINTHTQKLEPTKLEGAWPDSYLGVSWLPDNSGFVYLEFPETNPESNNFKKNTQTVLYKISNENNKVIPIVGPNASPELNLPESGSYPIATITNEKDQYIITYQATVENFWNAYYAPITDLENPNKIEWKPLFRAADKVVTNSVEQLEDQFIFKSGLSNDDYTINRLFFNAIDFKSSEVLIKPNDNEVINSFKSIGNEIFYVTTTSGVQANFYRFDGEESDKIELPEISGNARLTSISPSENDLWVSTSGWLSNTRRYKYNLERREFLLQPLSTSAQFPEFNNFTVKEIDVSSHDGVLVPLTIIYNKNIKMDGKNPAIFYGYGAYGTSVGPFYAPSFLTWVMEGGVFCIPHVRGGGEKGDAWHKAGLIETKENTWKDLIACVEYVQGKNFTSPSKTSIYSMSAGGIMVGKAMTERPDLFTAVIAEVASLNPSRHEFKKDGGGSNVKEYGTINDSIQYKSLLKMDAYRSLEDNVTYPAVYLTAGFNDPRVPAWIPGKFAARLQNNKATEKPVLFYVDFEGGHGSTLDDNTKFYLEYANVFSFALWQSGHKDYQLVSKK